MTKALLLLVLISLYSAQLFAKTIVISDLDDTLKKANSMGKIGSVYHFLKKKPYEEMRDLFLEIKNHEESRQEEIKYFYVSAAYDFTFDAQKWLQKNNFPMGPSFLKSIKDHESIYEYKSQIIKKIISQELLNNGSNENLEFLFFGDNAQVDQLVYKDLIKSLGINGKIYIRDVRAEATYFDGSLEVKKLPGVNYYFSEVELLLLGDFNFLTHELKDRIMESYKSKKLIPEYTLTTLKNRIKSTCKEKGLACSEYAKNLAKAYWSDYYGRY